MRGGVLGYAAQASPKIDAARTEKDPFRMETRLCLCKGSWFNAVNSRETSVLSSPFDQSKNILAESESDCNMISAQVHLLCPLPLMASPFEEAKMKRFKLLLFVAVLAGLAALAYAVFDDGKAAYDRGDYARAYKEFKPLAKKGDLVAQFYLGVMCDFDRGVSQDYIQAMK